MAGARSKLTPEMHDKIVAAVRAGNYYRAAARYARIHHDTLYDWIRRGDTERARLDADPNAKPDKREAPYVRLSDALMAAEAEAEIEAVAHWKAASRNDWRAAKEWLARRHGEDWGDRSRVEHSGPEGAPITLAGLENLMGISDDGDAPTP
jgi:hypothetical protein